MAFADGRCRTSRRVLAEPDLTLALSAADFLSVALDGAEPVALAFAGRLRLSGDPALALKLGRCFAGRR